MPWCPKCKNEYIAGISICKDCNVPLVDSLDDDIKLTHIPLIYLEKEPAKRLVDFLKYSDIKSACMDYDDELISYCVYVLPEDEEKAAALVKIFKESEVEDQLNNESDIDNNNSDSITTDEAPVYENKSSKYTELKSSGISLLVFTFIGAIYMLLNIVGIIKYNSSPLFYLVFSALLIVFLYGGINSLTSAKKFKSEAGTEEKTTKEIKDWFFATYKAHNIDELIDDTSLPDEVLFFKRNEKIKELIVEHFGKMDDGYLDNLCEEIIDKLY